MLAGAGPDEQRLRDLAARRGPGGVVFAGFVPSAALPRYYCAADLYVHCASADAHPLAVTEAVYCGLPAVVSDRCGSYGPTDDVRIGLNGRVYACGDGGALASAVLGVLDSSPARRAVHGGGLDAHRARRSTAGPQPGAAAGARQPRPPAGGVPTGLSDVPPPADTQRSNRRSVIYVHTDGGKSGTDEKDHLAAREALVYARGRGDTPNRIGTNGEARLQRCVHERTRNARRAAIFDIGANEGAWLDSFFRNLADPAQNRYRVHAFESVPSTLQRLKVRMEALGVDSLVSRFPVAIVRRPGLLRNGHRQRDRGHEQF